jgi:PTH1 family peptidyl-tRNA hydrolase
VKLIVGLGNPGLKYAGTRHNVGFAVVDVLASRWDVSLAAEKFHGWFGLCQTPGERVALLKPTTFMNRSGRAVLAVGRFYKLALSDLLVVSDDLALPLGRLRMRVRGSAGGHNGLQDIADRLGTDDWCRLRIGIGEPIGDPVAYVLERFRNDEEAMMRRAHERAADAVACWMEHGADLAMTRFNGDLPPKGDEGAASDG